MEKITVSTVTINDEMKYKDKVILKYTIEYPEFKSQYHYPSLIVINSFYKTMAFELQSQCRNEIYNDAVEQVRYSVENNYPVRAFEVFQTYYISYLMSCVISLYQDKYEYTGGAHGTTLRTSQTWNVENDGMIKLNELFCTDIHYREYIINAIEKEAKSSPEKYFNDYKSLIVKNFNEQNFYCKPEEIIIYYQQYDIAPYAGGIMEFLIGYTDCVINPVKKCRSL